MPESNPWKNLGARLVYENQWLTLREDRVIRPDGQEGICSLIDTRIGTAAIALTPSREAYLVGQYRYPTDAYSWKLIEGGADPGETPLAMALKPLLSSKKCMMGSVVNQGRSIAVGVRQEAVREMRVGPSWPGFRTWQQNTLRCVGKEPSWQAVRKRRGLVIASVMNRGDERK